MWHLNDIVAVENTKLATLENKKDGLLYYNLPSYKQCILLLKKLGYSFANYKKIVWVNVDFKAITVRKRNLNGLFSMLIIYVLINSMVESSYRVTQGLSKLVAFVHRHHVVSATTLHYCFIYIS